MNDQLTHFNEQNRAKMVDVSDKDVTKREAVAYSRMVMEKETLARIREGRVAKGDVLAVAQVAGVMAAKKTWEIIPMCHPLPLTGIDIRFSFADERTLEIEAAVKTTGKTGVEMEALTAASVAALTVYDMCKAMDKAMVIESTGLLRKTGGKSGDFTREDNSK
ncbi:cyclic pyranopterin monophosphate synthase MoaC [Brevibacillus panacihumi]|uniref:cyclic pyranopterin monophosphate synthase MoaC n=1 Tax=Brevibacillus panacihumi TaxID=497735 RepID=UPI003D24E715